MSNRKRKGAGAKAQISTITVIAATDLEIKAAFTEWDRRFREDPEAFESEASRLLKGTPKTYGDAAGPYFIEILETLSRKPARKRGRR